MFVNNITSDVLIIRYFLSSLIFSVCSFQGTHLTDCLSVITYTKCFVYLITGKPSYQNSTSLLIGLAAISCCSSLPVFIFNFGSGSASVLLFLNWRPPTLPHRLQCSTIGRPGLNHRVRDGNGCCPWTHRHQKSWVLSEVFSSLELRLFAALGEVLSNLVRRTLPSGCSSSTW